MITSSKLEFVRTDDDGNKWWRVILTADAEPDSLELTGADVSDLASNVRFAAGSVLLTPSANYVAYVDGTFGGLNGEGIKGLAITGVELHPAPSSLVPLLVTEGQNENIISATFDASEAIKDKPLTIVITPTASWTPYLDDGDEVFEVGSAGEPLTVAYTPVSNSVTDIIFAAIDNPNAGLPRTAYITATIKYDEAIS